MDRGTALLPEALWIQELCGSWNCADPEALLILEMCGSWECMVPVSDPATVCHGS